MSSSHSHRADRVAIVDLATGDVIGCDPGQLQSRGLPGGYRLLEEVSKLELAARIHEILNDQWHDSYERGMR